MSDEIKQAEETAAPEAAQENKDGAAKAPEKKPEQAPKVKKSWKMTRGEWILIGIAVVLCIIVALLNLRPQEAVGTLAVVSGTGEVIDPDDGIAAIGSGGMYALAAAKALKENTDLDAKEIAEKAIRIASEICIFTNGNITLEEV